MARALKPVAVRVLDGYRLWLRYTDGAEGEVDLSHLAGQGVFKVWQSRETFEAVRIGAGGALEWPGNVDLCPDAVYLRLTGTNPEELFSRLLTTAVDA